VTRDEVERALIRRFGRVFSEQERRILARLDDDDGPTIIGSNEFWAEAATEYPWVRSILEKGAVAAALAVLPASVGASAQETAQVAAVEWARAYSLGLIGGINDTSRSQATEVLDRWFAGEFDRAELERRISGIFSPDRASTIGVTESTRAAVSGQLEAGRTLRDLGFVPHYIWHQTSDYEGCGCDELNGVEVDESTTPPLHPNCNCYIQTTFDPVEGPPQKTAVQAIQEDLDSVRSSLVDGLSEIGARLEARDDEMARRVQDTIKRDIAQLDSARRELAGRVSGGEGDVASLRSDLSAMRGDLNEARGMLSSWSRKTAKVDVPEHSHKAELVPHGLLQHAGEMGPKDVLIGGEIRPLELGDLPDLPKPPAVRVGGRGLGPHAHDHGSMTGLTDDDHPQYGQLAENELVTGSWKLGNSSDYMQVSTNGFITFAGDGKCYLTMRPTLYAGVVAGAGKPTSVNVGIHAGYSLPVGNGADGELLYFRDYVPGRWDGESDPVVSVLCFIDTANTAGEEFALTLNWANYDPTAGAIISTDFITAIAQTELSAGHTAQYSLFKVQFTIDASAAPKVALAKSDHLGLKLWRSAVTGAGADECEGEVVVIDTVITYMVDRIFKAS
jgi:hypothetical protein